MLRFTVDGRPVTPEEMPSASNQVVTPSYFEAMGIGLAAGRLFTPQDDENAPRVALVNETLARRYWPGASALGQRLHLEGEGADTPPLVVAGVVRDVHQLELQREVMPELYRCYYQAPTASMSAVIRTAADPLALAQAARREVAALNPSQPVYNIETLDVIVRDSMWQTRLTTVLFGVFCGLALALAAIGIYGVSAYAVARRTREIGLRMALGAGPVAILRLVIGHGLLLGLAGVMSGMVVAYSFARAMSEMLYGIDPVDPLTYLAAPLFLLAVVAAANLAPALRAARTDPMTALRHE
jgi:putative ABC transport system permease protein